MGYRRLTAVLAATSLLSGCGNGSGPFGIGAMVGGRTLAAAEPLFSKGLDQCLDNPGFLLAVFGKSDVPTKASAETGNGRPTNCDQEIAQFRQTLLLDNPSQSADARRGGDNAQNQNSSVTQKQDQSSGTGTNASTTSSLDYTKRERNEVIDALTAASNRKCGRYTELLKQFDGNSNASLAFLSLLTGGLGSFVGGAATAKALSGTSAIFSGTRAALNEVHFTNQTIHLLADAYEKRRIDLRRKLTNREACPVENYSLMRGFEDVLQYHNACSIVVGLQAASQAVQRSDNPGVETLKRSLAELSALRRQASYFATEDEPVVNIAPDKVTLDRLTEADKVSKEAATTAALRKSEYDLATKARLELAATASADEIAAADNLAADKKSAYAAAATDATNKADALNNLWITAKALPIRARNEQQSQEGQDPSEIASCPFTAKIQTDPKTAEVTKTAAQKVSGSGGQGD